MAQQTLRRILCHIQHALEVLWATVVRIRHGYRLSLHAIAHEQRQIVFIHRQHIIKALEIGSLDPPRTQCA